MLTSIEFLKRHRYSVKNMTEEQAEQFIIDNGISKFVVFKYMKKRAMYLLKKRGLK